MSNTTISDENLTSYHSAEYHVYFEPNFFLKIGQHNEQLMLLYKKFNQYQSAFITAYNPYSQERTLIQNTSQNSELEEILISMDYQYILGEGVCSDSGWPGEKSFLILGIDLETSKKLGNQFQQNAILWSGKDAVPQLILLK